MRVKRGRDESLDVGIGNFEESVSPRGKRQDFDDLLYSVSTVGSNLSEKIVPDSVGSHDSLFSVLGEEMSPLSVGFLEDFRKRTAVREEQRNPMAGRLSVVPEADFDRGTDFSDEFSDLDVGELDFGFDASQLPDNQAENGEIVVSSLPAFEDVVDTRCEFSSEEGVTDRSSDANSSLNNVAMVAQGTKRSLDLDENLAYSDDESVADLDEDYEASFDLSGQSPSRAQRDIYVAPPVKRARTQQSFVDALAEEAITIDLGISSEQIPH